MGARIFSLLLLYIGHVSLALAQVNYNTNWILDQNSGVKYTNNPNNFVSPPNMDVQEGNAVVSNGTNILFQTDGVNIFDATGNVMVNGNNIGGHLSTSQLVTAKMPGSDSLYYVFTINDYSTAQEYKYTIIDMSLNGGLGEVISKGNLIGSGYTEKITACMHGNCKDIWIITQQCGTNTYEARLLDSTGLQPPVISSVGSSTGMYCIGTMKVSQDRTKIATADYSYYGFVEVYDFDNTTGIISNPVNYPASRPYGLEFSPNGENIYYTERTYNGHLHQINLPTGTNTDLGTIATSSQTGGQLQLAKDGIIYGISTYSNKMFGIENPDAAGTSANLNLNAHILTAGTNTQLGLPQNINTCGVLLYLEWLRTEGTLTDDHTIIQWEVAEKNTDYYSVKRMDDLNRFKEVARVPANPSGQYHTILDYNQEAYYRITRVDQNGEKEHSDIFKTEGHTTGYVTYYDLLGRKLSPDNLHGRVVEQIALPGQGTFSRVVTIGRW